jgi:aryl-alcohol dehydrogenase-like predicted oxidoreductase
MRRRTRHFDSRKNDLARHGEWGAEDEVNQALDDIRMIVRETGISMTEIAIKWVLSKSGITCALVGARNRKQLEFNVKATADPLAHEIVEKLNEVTLPLKEKMGASFDYYESTENDRTR